MVVSSTSGSPERGDILPVFGLLARLAFLALRLPFLALFPGDRLPERYRVLVHDGRALGHAGERPPVRGRVARRDGSRPSVLHQFQRDRPARPAAGAVSRAATATKSGGELRTFATSTTRVGELGQEEISRPEQGGQGQEVPKGSGIPRPRHRPWPSVRGRPPVRRRRRRLSGMVDIRGDLGIIGPGRGPGPS